MAAARQLVMPTPTPANERAVGKVMARAVRLALWPMLDEAERAAEVHAVAGGDAGILRVARRRVERSLATEWSQVAARAAQLLGVAERLAAEREAS